jgi:hypothetical protein
VQLPVALYGVIIEIAGFRCPLTPFEKWLRGQAGSAGYDGGFVEHCIVRVLYPGEFTSGVKALLAGIVILMNAVAYHGLRRRRFSSAHSMRETMGREPSEGPPRVGGPCPKATVARVRSSVRRFWETRLEKTSRDSRGRSGPS